MVALTSFRRLCRREKSLFDTLVGTLVETSEGGSALRVAQNSKFLARFRSAGSLLPTPFLRVAPLRWLRPGGSAAEKKYLFNTLVGT